MAKRGIYVTGVNALSEKLKKNATMDDVKRVVRNSTIDLEKEMKRKAQFKGHFQGDVWMSPTGFTRRSISSTIARGGMQGGVAPASEYAAYLEYGTRFMSAQSFVRPSFNQQKKIFLSDMKLLIK